MNYQTSIITPPLSFTEYSDISLKGRGDSYFIDLIPYTSSGLQVTESDPVPVTRTPTVHILSPFKEIANAVEEGEDIVLYVGLSEVSEVDTVVDYQITNGGVLHNEIFKDPLVKGMEDNFDYVSAFVRDTVDEDFVSLVGQAVIPAGSLVGEFSVSTLDNTLLEGYLSSRVATVTLTAQDNPSFIINDRSSSVTILLFDSSKYPSYDGEVGLYFQTHPLKAFEAVQDVVGNRQSISLGYELDDLGNLTEYTKAWQVQVDDVPVDVLRLLPDITSVADQDTIAPLDLTGLPPYYRAIIQIGRRV